MDPLRMTFGKGKVRVEFYGGYVETYKIGTPQYEEMKRKADVAIPKPRDSYTSSTHDDRAYRWAVWAGR